MLRFIAPYASSVFRLPRPGRVWLLNLTLSAAAVAVFGIAARDVPPLDAPISLEPWMLGLGFAAVEVFYVQLQFRRESLAFSLSEIPFVLGLFFVAPAELLLAQLLGTGTALAFHRRQRPIKLVFNLANLSFSGGLAILLFHWMAGLGEPLGPVGWTAALTAALAADLLAVGGIAIAMWLSAGRPPRLSELFGSGSVATFFNAMLALVSVTILWLHPQAAWMLAVLAGMLFLAYRAYGSMLRKHEALELLHRATRATQQAVDVPAVLVEILQQSRHMFGAERSEALLFAPDGSATRSSVDASDRPELLTPVRLQPTEGIWARVTAEGRGVLLSRPIDSPQLAAHFGARGIRDLMAAPLMTEEGPIGTLLVANRIGEVQSFSEPELKLFETFANHAAASLRNGQLISRLREQAAENEWQALHDALTGLPNRPLFSRRLDEALACDSPTTRQLAVLLMDLDRFKEVNDTLGHHNGDLLLVHVAARLRETLDATLLLARMSGDEFAVLVPEADAEQAVTLAQQIRTVLQEPFLIDALTVEIGASIGIAMAPEHGTDANQLLQRADVAMYLAKRDGHGSEVYDASRDEFTHRRLALVPELRRAIEQDELVLAYQPKIELATGRVSGVEGLVRWRHPTHGLLTPEAFIPLAEHAGLIRLLTQRVLELAIVQCRRWRELGLDLTVAVNCSARDLGDVRFVEQVGALLAREQLPASALQLEITESAIMADPGQSQLILARLAEMGVCVAIDDFGTGYSSLSYLKGLTVHQLKIDRSFVSGMTSGEKDAALVRSVIDLAHNLGLRTVAEGVEDLATLQALDAMGCDEAQGYFIDRPMSGEQLVDRVRARAHGGTASQRRGERPSALRVLDAVAPD